MLDPPPATAVRFEPGQSLALGSNDLVYVGIGDIESPHKYASAGWNAILRHHFDPRVFVHVHRPSTSSAPFREAVADFFLSKVVVWVLRYADVRRPPKSGHGSAKLSFGGWVWERGNG